MGTTCEYENGLGNEFMLRVLHPYDIRLDLKKVHTNFCKIIG